MTKTTARMAVIAILVGAMLPGVAALAAVPDGGACTSAVPGTVTCELWATTGSVTLPGAAGNVTIPIWGYSTTSTPGSAQVPGPVIRVAEGDDVTITVHNALPSGDTALLVTGQAGLPAAAAAPTGTSVVTYNNVTAGTFLYEASGVLADGPVQVAMGMYGAMIVDSATAGQAYSGAATAYADDTLLVLSEIDPALNNSADPTTFDMRNFKGRYQLINGDVFRPSTYFTANEGQTMLARVVNAGANHHSLAVLGADQVVIAMDGHELPYTRRMVAETLPAGSTQDVLIDFPAGSPSGSLFPVYDAALQLRNPGGSSGGMLGFFQYNGSVTGGTGSGPLTSNVVVSPAFSDGATAVSVSATVGATADTAQLVLDNGTALGMTVAGTNASVSVSGATLTTLGSGIHVLKVRASADGGATYGPFASGAVRVDIDGPTTAAWLEPATPTNGTTDVILRATGNDIATGGSGVSGAEYRVNGGTALAMTAVSGSGPIASFQATISASVINGLTGANTAGTFAVEARSTDAAGHTGAWMPVDLTVDKIGPTYTGLMIKPTATNGFQFVNSTTPAVRVDVTVQDNLSAIAAGEGFIDTQGVNGSGFPFTAKDGVFGGGTSEAVYAYIPATTIAALADGTHTIIFHGKDAAGNWGGTVSVNLAIDRLAPLVINLSATPNPTNGAPDFALAGIVNDTTGGAFSSGVTAAYWYEGADPGLNLTNQLTVGAGNAISGTVSTAGMSYGNHTIQVRARDAAGNWSAPSALVVTVSHTNGIFADNFESGTTSAWSVTNGPVQVTSAAALDGVYGMQIDLVNPGARTAVLDQTAFHETTFNADFLFDPNNAIPVNPVNGNRIGMIIYQIQGNGAYIARIQFQRTVGNVMRVRLQAQDGGVNANGLWVPITGATTLGLRWQDGAGSNVDLLVGGSVVDTLTVDMTGRTVENVQLGAVNGTASGSGSMYFDNYVSWR